MKAYLCTDRGRKPSSRALRQTRAAAKQDPLLCAFLEDCDDSYYDWGDDPSFYAAQHLLGNVRKASWGVCRPDVRRKLGKRDLVVFFCGCQDKRVWRYYFVGFGTVRAPVERAVLWTNPAYAPYRKFYNVLARLDGGRLIQSETIHPYHKDWESRAGAPYVLFDAAQSAFNIKNPHHVATWEEGASIPETWCSDVDSKEIERLLFVERGIDRRRLRVTPSRRPHPYLNLLRDRRGLTRPGRGLSELKRALSQLV